MSARRTGGKGPAGSVQAREFDDEDLGGAFRGDFRFLAARTVEVGQLRVGAILDAKPGIGGPRELRSVQSEVVRGAGGEADHREPDVGVRSRVIEEAAQVLDLQAWRGLVVLEGLRVQQNRCVVSLLRHDEPFSGEGRVLLLVESLPAVAFPAFAGVGIVVYVDAFGKRAG